MHRHYNLLTFYLWNKRVFFPRRKDSAKLAARKRFLLLPLSFSSFSFRTPRWTPPSDPNFIASWFPPPLRSFPTIHQSPAKILFFSSSIHLSITSKNFYPIFFSSSIRGFSKEIQRSIEFHRFLYNLVILYRFIYGMVHPRIFKLLLKR